MAIRFLSEEAEKLYRQRADDGFSFESIIRPEILEAAVAKLGHPALPDEVPFGYDPALLEATCRLCERKFKPRMAAVIDITTGDFRMDGELPMRTGSFLVLEDYRINRFAAHPFCPKCIHEARKINFTPEGREEKRNSPLYMMAWENAAAEVDRRNRGREEKDDELRYEQELRKVRLAALFGVTLPSPKPPKRRNGGQALGNVAVEGAGITLKEAAKTTL